MTSNELVTGRGSPGDATASEISTRERVAWIDERMNEAYQLANSNAGGMMSVQRLQELFAIVHEFAELLRVHFAGVGE